MKDVRRGIRGAYFDPVFLMVILFRGDARRVERFGWALAAVRADNTPLAVWSNAKVQRNIMTKSGQKDAHQILHLETEEVETGRMKRHTSKAVMKPAPWV